VEQPCVFGLCAPLKIGCVCMQLRLSQFGRVGEVEVLRKELATLMQGQGPSLGQFPSFALLPSMGAPSTSSVASEMIKEAAPGASSPEHSDGSLRPRARSQKTAVVVG
jgi:hypothetical protein